ncbi:MAG: NfeD family protein [Thermoplasmata archaeon]
MRKIITIPLIILDWIFFAFLIISISLLLITNYNGFNFSSFTVYGAMTIAFFLLFYYFRKIIWAVKENAMTGPESLTGKIGIVTDTLKPEGEIRIEGITWKAKSINNEFIERGSQVIVKKVENISLLVEKVKK